VIYASVIDLRTDEAYYWTWFEGERAFVPRSSADDRVVHPVRQPRSSATPIWASGFAGVLAMLVTPIAARRHGPAGDA